MTKSTPPLVGLIYLCIPLSDGTAGNNLNKRGIENLKKKYDKTKVIKKWMNIILEFLFIFIKEPIPTVYAHFFNCIFWLPI